MCRLFQLGPQDMQWYHWHSEARSTFRCKRCTGLARPVDGRRVTEVTVGREKLEVVPSFCYVGDCLSSGVGFKVASITGCMGEFKWDPVHPRLQLIFDYLQRKRLQVVHQERHAPCKRNMGPNFIWAASPASNDWAMIQWTYGVNTKCQFSP